MRTRFRLCKLAMATCLLLVLGSERPGFAAEHVLTAENLEQQLHDRLALAEPGDAILLPEGRFPLVRELVLGVRGVSVRGRGSEKTTLDFSKQRQGAQGFLARANDIALTGFTLLNPQGDGLVVRGADGARISDVSVHWTGEDPAGNGGYGIYPVMTKRAVVEDCYVTGASEAGIYVGQSLDALVKGNRVEQNVVGLDIENSTRVLVSGNAVSRNSIGVLVSARPHLLQQRSYDVRIEGNDIAHNNTKNFGAPGSHVASFGEGYGIAVVAAQRTEVTGNRLEDHLRGQVLLLSYQSLKSSVRTDPLHQAELVEARVVENRFEPAAERARAVAADWRDVRGMDVIWDGIESRRRVNPGFEKQTLCMREDESIRFLDTSRALAGGDGQEVDLSARPPVCTPRSGPDE